MVSNMRRPVLELLTAFLVVTIGLTCRTTVSTPNQPTPTQATEVKFYPLPQPLVVEAGEAFTVACVVEDVVDLVGLDAQIAWDINYLSYVSHTATIPVEDYPVPIPPSPYAGILHDPEYWIRDEVSPLTGTYWVVLITWGGEPSFSGSGTVFVMTFRALAPTSSTLIRFTSTDLADPGSNPIPHTTSDCSVEIASGPATVNFDPGHVEVELGEEFEVAVLVEDAFSRLYGLQVGINWNTTHLSHVNHTAKVPVETYPGGLLHDPVYLIKNVVNETGVPDAPHGTLYWLSVVSNPPALAFNGSGTALTITFKAIQPGMTALSFTDLELVDQDTQSIPYVFFGGIVDTADTTPPDFESVDWNGMSPSPYLPSEFIRTGEPVAISVNITDLSRVVKASLSCRVCGGAWWNTTMTYNITSDLWTTVIPGQLGGTTVEFFITATDNEQNTNISSTFAYHVRTLLVGDVDGDGDVDIFDIVRVAGNYGKTLPP